MSRQSFYPVPPSTYPKPLVEPCPAFETSYGHNHCSHSLRDAEYFRSRSVHPLSLLSSVRAQTAPLQTTAQQTALYPAHGIGAYQQPYYRRDSKGFRQTYIQPKEIDDQYASTKDSRRLVEGGFTFCHPSSRATYSCSRSSNGGGALFGTTYRNSGLYDSSCGGHVPRVTRDVAHGLDRARAALTRMPLIDTAANTYQNQEWREAPPTGAQLYQSIDTQQDVSAFTPLSVDVGVGSRTLTHRQILNDPLLSDPLANAYRKARTVYKRAYGKCQ